MSDDTMTAEAVNGSDLLPMPDGAMRLPSGGWALFKPFDLATGKDIKRIRGALDADGTGEILTGAMARTLAALVVEWQFPRLEQVVLPCHSLATLDRIPALDLLTMEEYVQEFTQRVLGRKPEQGKTDPS